MLCSPASPGVPVGAVPQILLLPACDHKGTRQRTKASVLRTQNRRKSLGLVMSLSPGTGRC